VTSIAITTIVAFVAVNTNAEESGLPPKRGVPPYARIAFTVERASAFGLAVTTTAAT
jgi:hypothetical protein